MRFQSLSLLSLAVLFGAVLATPLPMPIPEQPVDAREIRQGNSGPAPW
ncbi:uncharacterized protein FIBRA_02354 [Fibroporia radiculosa]|uniref:Uncharacterized protein n=1 Tax=Fibroporia radiculosa TaxID=599839 RepID=J4H1T3_9APHY|nr:uncharacterized protein FIBRA_02354 [Fibroporia radiculosa]CCM00324.1 predicted protein [Fibroporia radiculosa]